MKNTFVLLLLLLSTNILFAQKDAALNLVDEGTTLHDKGDYAGALAKYNKALDLDKDNLAALAEKAYTLDVMGKYDECINCCETAISKHPGEDDLKTVYITYGNALDEMKKTDKAIEAYDAGLKLFPDFYQLYFNKGIALAGQNKISDAYTNLQKSAMLKPTHPGTHNALGALLDNDNKRIPALLAYCRFLSLEPEGDRAQKDLSVVQRIMKGNAEKTGKKSISVTVSPDMLADTAANGKPKENSFSSTDFTLAMDAALDYDKKYAKTTDVEKFIRKLNGVCESLSSTKKDNYGFYWDYYVPYFIEMKDKDLVETFAYIAFASSGKAEVNKWLKNHQENVDRFFNWSKTFIWKTS